jgi:hypothetical protein
MGVGPQTPLGCFRGRSPAGTCRNIYADRRARLHQTVLVPVHPLRSTRRSEGRGVSRPIALHTCQLLGPTVPCPDNSAIRSRRPAASAFASESHLRCPGGISAPAGHPARPTRASSRGSPVLMHRLARGQPSPSICSRIPERPVAARRETPSDGTATTLRSCRADLAAFRAHHALGTSMRRWGCAGRSYPSTSTSRSPPTSWERGSRREQLAPIQPQACIGRVLVWACFVRRKFSPHLAYSDRKRASGCSHATSKHRAASAGLLATAGEPASCTFLMPCIRDARVPLAAAGLFLERRLRWQVCAPTW